MTPVRMGVVGLGMMGRHHVRLARSTEGVDLVGVHDPLGDPHGVANDVPNHESLEGLIAAGIDAAVVATPTDDHLPIGRQLAAAGVHMLIEKPLATDVRSGEELLASIEAAGVIAAVGHVERFNPAIRALKRRLTDFELGDLYSISTSRQGPFPDRIRDVGVIKDLGTHDIDLTMWIAGERFASVSAQVAHRAGRPHEDLVVAIGRLESGLVTNHEVNWLTPTKERRIVVTGSKGRYVADTVTSDLFFFENGSVATEWEAISRFRGVVEGDMIRYAIPKPEPLMVEHEGFRDAVVGEGGDIVTAAEGLDVLRVADAMSRSAANGTVEVPR
ncbi:Gfo/Idh/MocA family oxidoreductase [Actinospongicola halichondriae]|uniref:Gfo/Idh/MocA family oxidoreductase n=1 Tax=Actinospongicola halichondriae TaxID=3236844 RepID=UPI003D376F28